MIIIKKKDVKCVSVTIATQRAIVNEKEFSLSSVGYMYVANR